MGACTAITRGGARCKGVAIDGSGYCYAHHPDKAALRRAHASKGGKRGGRGRPLSEVADAKGRLLDIADRMESGEMDTKTGIALSQVLNVFLRAVDLGLKAREQEELEARLSELEEQLDAGKGGYRGA